MVNYCTTDEWAIKKSTKAHPFVDFTAYAIVNDYPQLSNLEDMLEEMTEIMNNLMGTTTNITDTSYTTRLRRICYNGVEYMMDEEQSRSMEDKRTTLVPRLYMRPADRDWLLELSIIKDTRVVGGVGG